MKKRLFLIIPIALALLISFCAGAVAGSRWGNYDGYSIVRLLVNGTEVSGDVPAINLHGRTMVPVRLVAEALGAQVDWDEANYTAIISDPRSAVLGWPRQVNDYLNSLAGQATGWDWAIKQGLLQPVNAEAEGNGYKWHIYAVLAAPSCSRAPARPSSSTGSASGGGTLTATRLVVTPVRTMLEARWAGTGTTEGEPRVPWLQQWPPSATANGWGVRLLRPDGSQLAQGLGGGRIQSARRDDGLVDAAYTMFFDRCDALPDQIILHVGAAVYVRDETRVPLEPGATVSAADGSRISVTAVNETNEAGTITLDYKPDPRFPPTYADWEVLDNAGERTAMQFGPATDNGFALSWQLPAGRKAVAVILPGYWRAEEAGDLSIETK